MFVLRHSGVECYLLSFGLIALVCGTRLHGLINQTHKLFILVHLALTCGTRCLPAIIECSGIAFVAG
jgi:hypothetical protein